MTENKGGPLQPVLRYHRRQQRAPQRFALPPAVLLIFRRAGKTRGSGAAGLHYRGGGGRLDARRHQARRRFRHEAGRPARRRRQDFPPDGGRSPMSSTTPSQRSASRVCANAMRRPASCSIGHRAQSGTRAAHGPDNLRLLVAPTVEAQKLRKGPIKFVDKPLGRKPSAVLNASLRFRGADFWL